MKQFFILAMLVFSTAAFSQTIQQVDKDIKKLSDNMKSLDQQKLSLDSLNEQLEQSIRASTARIDSASRAMEAERMAKNMDYFMQEQTARNAASKKRIWMYFGVGAFFLTVLVAGLLRKSKKQ